MRITHPYLTRLAHWLIAITLPVLAASGLQILQAFPVFGPKIPTGVGIPLPSWAGIGGWLGGALAWHYTFAWLFAIAVALYLIDLLRGGWKRLWLKPTDWKNIGPMARHYFLRGPKPPNRDRYNPLQKAAYLVITCSLLLVLIKGAAMAQPVQLNFILRALGGWQTVRFLHFLCLCSFAAFVPGHLIMVILAGRPSIWAMLSGSSSVGHEFPAEPRAGGTPLTVDGP